MAAGGVVKKRKIIMAATPPMGLGYVSMELAGDLSFDGVAYRLM